jgi:NAD(P)-dependent dehydrogenase (short-subunit alcohol dehydrogenase family)
VTELGASTGSPETARMEGRVCLVTGATSGIGRETARGLAERGATVVIVARDASRGRATVEDLQKRTGSRAVEMLTADLASQEQIRNLARDFRERHPRLHVLLNNAGVVTPTRTVTVDGIETQFAVNHLAYFLLTALLLDVLKASAPSRIVNVSSQLERRGVIDFDDLGREKAPYDRMSAYCQSKLANILFTFELARRLEGTGVTANCLHPGVVGTKLVQEIEGRPGPLRFLTKLKRPPPREGAHTSLYLATAPELSTTSGRYFRESAESRPSPPAYDAAAGRRLWEVSEKLTGMMQAGSL